MTGLQSISRRQLEEEAQHVIGGTSFKFVTEPSINEVKQDVILALKQFSNSVRLWDFNKNRKNPQQPTIQNENEPLQQTIDNGLGTKLRPNNVAIIMKTLIYQCRRMLMHSSTTSKQNYWMY